jgi:hypothetical protein
MERERIGVTSYNIHEIQYVVAPACIIEYYTPLLSARRKSKNKFAVLW